MLRACKENQLNQQTNIDLRQWFYFKIVSHQTWTVSLDTHLAIKHIIKKKQLPCRRNRLTENNNFSQILYEITTPLRKILCTLYTTKAQIRNACWTPWKFLISYIPHNVQNDNRGHWLLQLPSFQLNSSLIDCGSGSGGKLELTLT